MKTSAAAALAAVSLSAAIAAETPAKPEGRFYKDIQLFSTAANETAEKQPIEHFGPVGIGIDLLLPPFQMQLSRIDAGSPAEATGKLKVGQWIETINGEKLKDIDPRIQLGAIITRAEATDGVIKLMVKDKPDAKAEEVVVKIPVLGAYSKTWPLNCPKSDKIVRNLADYLARTGSNGMGLGQLFLLSTGEEKDLEVVRGWIKKEVEQNKNVKELVTYPWYAGYGGIGLCEYYLRTGDESVIPLIELNADFLRRTMSNGSWNQKGGLNFSYGYLNAAGVPSATFLLLARQCGAKVDEYTLQESLKQFYRFAGHGNVAYGDGLPEVGFVDNGKTGKLAFQMAAAASLTPEGENSIYAKARDICAVKSFYSTSWMLHGHTGGGIGEIWRGAAMGLMHDKTPLKYREFMDNRQWFYELSRRFDGSMGIVSATFGNGGRYDEPRSWGIGLALSYTMPRKHLRIAGAPPSRFCKPYPLPKRPWGNDADESFLSFASSADPSGKVPDWNREKLATDSSAAIGRRLNAPDVSDEVLLKYTRHPDQGVREMAASAIAKRPGDQMILDLLKDKDPRVRQAGCHAISARTAPTVKYGPPQADRLTDEMARLLIGMINDPDESLWVVHHALNSLGVARTELLAPHLDRLCHWLLHEEWWMRKGALAAVGNMAVDERYGRKLIPVIGKMITSNRNTLMMWQLWGLCGRMREASPAVQSMAKDMLAQAYGEFPEKIVAKGGLHLDHAQSMMFENIAGSLASHPGGLDVLAALANERFPNKTLAHKDLFMNADASQLAAATKQKVNTVIKDQFIPEYIADNILHLQHVRPDPVVTERTQQTKLEGLATLYTKMGVDDYTWHEFGPEWTEMKWDYITFDPPETLSWKPGEWRYRKVTCPAGMENWFAADFDAEKAGWKSGLQPIGQENDKLRTEPKPFIDQLMNRPENEKKPCTTSYCRCCEPMKTFWEKEVLLMRGTFAIPSLKSGHRYRLVIGGMSCFNTGDGVRVYVNGEEVYESKTGGLRAPACFYVDEKHLSDFQSGTVTIAVTGFLKIHKRSGNKGNQIAVWLEEMKLPPLDDSIIRKAAMTKPLLSSAWQALQNPEDASVDPEIGKYKWDGKCQPNKALVGTWTQVGQVASIDAFKPSEKPVHNKNAPMQKVGFREDGVTDDPLCFWSGDTLIHLAKLEALKMTPRTIGGTEYLFIETGGFTAKNKAGWRSPLYVMKRE